MRRKILSICLNQTLHFQLKPGVPHDVAVREVQAEYEGYQMLLKRNRTKYKIIDEKIQDDGSIIVKVKKQLNNYDVGDYLN